MYRGYLGTMSKNFERGGRRGPPDFDGTLEGVHPRSESGVSPEALEGREHRLDHLALVYETRKEQFDAVVPFVREGIERGERCLYIADENSREAVLAALRDGGVDVDGALESGALSVHSVGETYLKDGSSTSTNRWRFSKTPSRRRRPSSRASG